MDVGTYNQERTDYPIYAVQVVDLMVREVVDCGVLLCSTGIGMAIVANRYPSIYAAVVWNNDIVKQAKQEDNINVLVIPSDVVSVQESVDMIHIWMTSEFRGGRYAQRLAMIDK
jgi:ribose 5-phosphate isomerase B